MEYSIKYRVIGIAVLVAVIAIILPFILKPSSPSNDQITKTKVIPIATFEPVKQEIKKAALYKPEVIKPRQTKVTVEPLSKPNR